MHLRTAWVLIAVLVIVTRLCHLDIVWVEEGYPTAAALQMLAGKTIYKDFWFDKPPLFPAIYLLWGASTGLALRIAGALYVLLAAWSIFLFARLLWGESEALLAAALMAFSLTFWIPSSVMVLGPDMLMIVPHVLAVYWAWRGKALLSGLACGVALGLNVKALFVMALCGIFLAAQLPWFLVGTMAASSIWLGWLVATGGLADGWRQVWQWGLLYSANVFGMWEALTRTASWAGFHAALVVGVVVWFWYERQWRFALWLMLSVAAVCAGWRFFPRYYFQLLPVCVLLGARGLLLIPRGWWRCAAFTLFLIPLIRFGPRYGQLATDLLLHRPHEWRDLAMSNDTVAAAKLLPVSQGDTLLVWGYRPDLFALTRLPAGTPFLDSQPLTGVIADRHLTSTEQAAPQWARENRAKLVSTRPTWIADGLGPYNKALAISAYPDLQDWLANYKVIGHTEGFVIYGRRP